MIERLASTAGLAIAIGVGLIFLFAGLSKLRHRKLLPGVIANYRIVPDAAVPVVATLLPVAELALSALLIVGERHVAPLVGIALLLAFAWAMAVNIRRGRTNIDCGCGSPHLRQTLGKGLVYRNFTLALALIPAIAFPALPTGADLPVGVIAGLLLYLLYYLFHALNALHASSPMLKAPA